jgi:hypothetical protein
MTDSSTSSTPKKWIVGIQQHCPPLGRTIGTIVKMPDPGNGDIRDYATMSSTDGNANDSYIAEFQSIPENFSSFIVGRHIIKDGDIYVINRIDPLFFYLATQSIDEQQTQGGVNNDRNNNAPQPKKQSWQPYDQFLEQSKLPREIAKVITEEQIQHICVTFDNEERYFKFNVDKALAWLQKKQERVLESLVRQDQRRRKRDENNSNAAKHNDQAGGSISANFNFVKAAPVAADPAVQENSKAASQPDTHALKIESFQIICNYLNETWSKKFIEHLGYTMEQVTNSAKTTRKSSSIVSNDIGTGSKGTIEEDSTNESLTKKAAANQKTISAARTVGNKRLAKVNKKGMRSIGSFFGAGKPKKAKR